MDPYELEITKLHDELVGAEQIGHHDSRIHMPNTLKHLKYQIIKAKIMAWNNLHTTEGWEKVSVDVYGQTITLSTYSSKGQTALCNCQQLIIDDNGRKHPCPGRANRITDITWTSSY